MPSSTRQVKITINGESMEERSTCSKIFTGDAGCLYNALCCPIVMGFHAFRVYVFACSWIYFTWAIDKAFCAIFRVVCSCCCM